MGAYIHATARADQLDRPLMLPVASVARGRGRGRGGVLPPIVSRVVGEAIGIGVTTGVSRVGAHICIQCGMCKSIAVPGVVGI
jgi:hypothetical protein